MKCVKCKKREATCVHLQDKYQDKVKSKNHRLVAKKHPEYFLNVCDICHAKIHGTSVKMNKIRRYVDARDRTMTIINTIKNQIRSLSRLEIMIPEWWDEEVKNWEKEKKEIEKKIKKEIEENGFKVWHSWLKDIKGVSYNTAAKLFGHIDIENTPNVSSLWRYCGLDPTYIRRKKGMTQEEAKKCGKPYLKKELLGVLGDSFIKQRTPKYRDIYDYEKEAQLKRKYKEGELKDRYNGYKKKDTHLSQGHAHNRAVRKMIKVFLEDLWIEWRKGEGLEVTDPYQVKYLNHKKL